MSAKRREQASPVPSPSIWQEMSQVHLFAAPGRLALRGTRSKHRDCSEGIWGMPNWIDKFDAFDEQRIVRFVKTYRGIDHHVRTLTSY